MLIFRLGHENLGSGFGKIKRFGIYDIGRKL